MGVLLAGVIVRIAVTVLIAFGDKLNLKEKIFVSLSWMAKATVQAALGPVALRRLHEDHTSTEAEFRYAEVILTICVLSIVVTAPIGAILISLSGTKLLTKTKQLHVVEGSLDGSVMREHILIVPYLSAQDGDAAIDRHCTTLASSTRRRSATIATTMTPNGEKRSSNSQKMPSTTALMAPSSWVVQTQTTSVMELVQRRKPKKR